MSRKAKDISVGILRWLLKEWVKALLGVAAILLLGYLGWVYRTYIKNWLVAKYSLETYGLVWIAIIVGIIFLSALTFWLIIREPKKKKLTDETDIRNELNDWWKRDKPIMHERRAYGTPQSEFVIHCRSVDRHRSLKKGSAAKFLPGIIENDNAYCIKSKGKETIVVQRKGLTIKAGPNGPFGGYL